MIIMRDGGIIKIMLIDRLLGKKKDIKPKYDDTRWFNIAEKPIKINNQADESRTKYRKK